jgi:hypothetical protein
MNAAPIFLKKFLNIQKVYQEIFQKKPTHDYPKLRPNVNFKSLIGLLAYNEAFSSPPYTGVGLETYFYCNYNDVSE